MIADGVPETPLSRMSNTAGAASASVASVCKMTQKSGDVIISLRSGHGFSVHSLSPRSTRPAALTSVSLGKLETA